MKYLIGNWKSNKTTKEAKQWITEVKKENLALPKNLKIALCPSFIHLNLFKRKIPTLGLGCQDLSPYSDGAYTGEISARMVANLVEYVILGHSERRRYFGESENLVSNKAIRAIENNITPIIAVDKKNWNKQLTALDDKALKKSIVMYEPPEAISKQVGPIGKGEAAPLSEVVKMILEIKGKFVPKAVIYGGSVKSANIMQFLNEEGIDGVLPGSASLNSKEWIKMVKNSVLVLNE